MHPLTAALRFLSCGKAGSLSALLTKGLSGKFLVFSVNKATLHSEDHLAVLLYIFFHHKDWVFLRFMWCFGGTLHDSTTTRGQFLFHKMAATRGRKTLVPLPSPVGMHTWQETFLSAFLLFPEGLKRCVIYLQFKLQCYKHGPVQGYSDFIDVYLSISKTLQPQSYYTADYYTVSENHLHFISKHWITLTSPTQWKTHSLALYLWSELPVTQWCPKMI